MKKTEEIDPVDNLKIKFYPRETDTISIEIPKDTIANLKKIASRRDMSDQALLKFYIGQGLRHDLTRFFGDFILEKTENVLTRHIQSEEEVSSIIQEIQLEAVG